MSFQPSAWPHFDEEQISAVAAVLRSGRVNYWTGTIGREFERDYAEYLRRSQAIALANGTVAAEAQINATNVNLRANTVVNNTAINAGNDISIVAATFRNEIVTGPGGSQVLVVDPSGNVVELFQPAGS